MSWSEARSCSSLRAWLGVHTPFQGQGLGERLLVLALRECFDVSITFPLVAVVLDCLDESTRAFYQRWNFREIPAHPLRLFVSAATLVRMVKA